MMHLEPRTREALLTRDDPPPGTEDRVLARVLSSSGFDPGGGEGLEPPVVGSGLGFAAKLVAATVVMTTSGLLLVAAVGRAVVDREPVPPPPRGDVVHANPAATPPDSPAPESIPVAAIASPTRATIRPVEAKAEPQQRPTDLEAELALLAAARKATQASAALGHLDQHLAEFPAGALAQEREVLRIDALCKLGRELDARTVARAMLLQHPDGPLRSRILAACPGVDLDG